MDNIAKRLDAHMDKHPIDLGDTDCETVLDQLYQAYAESHESDPPEIRDGFKGVLSARNGVYVPPERIPALEAIAFLRSVGAVPVLAHPYLNLKQDELERFIAEAKPCGLLAMETRYSTYTPEITEAAVRTAAQYGLLESGGSDYHGGNKPDIDLGSGRGGLCVPAELLTLLEKIQ